MGNETFRMPVKIIHVDRKTSGKVVPSEHPLLDKIAASFALHDTHRSRNSKFVAGSALSQAAPKSKK